MIRRANSAVRSVEAERHDRYNSRRIYVGDYQQIEWIRFDAAASCRHPGIGTRRRRPSAGTHVVAKGFRDRR